MTEKPFILLKSDLLLFNIHDLLQHSPIIVSMFLSDDWEKNSGKSQGTNWITNFMFYNCKSRNLHRHLRKFSNDPLQIWTVTCWSTLTSNFWLVQSLYSALQWYLKLSIIRTNMLVGGRTSLQMDFNVDCQKNKKIAYFWEICLANPV